MMEICHVVVQREYNGTLLPNGSSQKKCKYCKCKHFISRIHNSAKMIDFDLKNSFLKTFNGIFIPHDEVQKVTVNKMQFSWTDNRCFYLLEYRSQGCPQSLDKSSSYRETENIVTPAEHTRQQTTFAFSSSLAAANRYQLGSQSSQTETDCEKPSKKQTRKSVIINRAFHSNLHFQQETLVLNACFTSDASHHCPCAPIAFSLINCKNLQRK